MEVQNIKVDFSSKEELRNLKAVYKSNKQVGEFIIDEIKKIVEQFSMDDENLEKLLKQLTEQKVFLEYLVKLHRKIPAIGKSLTENNC